MKNVGSILLLTATLIISQNLMAKESCLALVNSLQDETERTFIVDGKESELRHQLTKGSIKDERITEIKERIEFLQKIRLQQNEKTVDAYIAVSECLKK